MSIQVISFNCVLTNKAGHFISSTFNRDVLSASPDGNSGVLQGLVQGLQNLTTGEKRSIALRAEEAYGLYDPKKVILYPRSKISRHARPGEMISVTGKSGTVRIYQLLKFHDNMALLDGNHPLAGQDLIFEIETISVRSATKEEIDSSSNPMSLQVLH